MRARNIKPGFFKNEDLAECDSLARILFAGLWCYCDREGRFEWRSKRIKIEILPYDDCDIEDLLSQLRTAGLVEKYEVEGKYYGSVPTFLNHQNPHKQEKQSNIPPLENVEKITEQVQKFQDNNGTRPEINGTSRENNETRPAESLNPESLNPEKDTTSQLYNESSDPILLAKLLYDCMLENDPKAKEPNYQKWSVPIDRLHRLDNRPFEEIEEVIRWTQQDDFEKSNILSAASLRRRYPQLRLRWERENERKRSSGEPRASPKRKGDYLGREGRGEGDYWPVDVE